jgi:hypothetical protein
MTNRRRIQRPRRAPISNECIWAFKEWRKLEDQCDCHEPDCNICKREQNCTTPSFANSRSNPGIMIGVTTNIIWAC